MANYRAHSDALYALDSSRTRLATRTNHANFFRS
jgi:hypothetical protein